VDVETESDAAPSIREALAAAKEEVEAREPEDAPADAAPQPPDEAAPEDEKPEKPTRARDDSGRFAAKAKAEEAAKAEKTAVTPAPRKGAPTQTPPPTDGSTAQTPAPAPATPTETYRAPQSWKPLLREKWASLPPDVQAEVVRREREVAQGLQEASQHRGLSTALSQALAPHQALIQASGGDPFRVISSLLQTQAALTMGPPEHRAQVLAAAIRNSGAPIELIAQALNGEAQAPQARQPQAIDPREIIRQAKQELMQDLQAQQQERLTAKARDEWEQFKAANEFAADLAPAIQHHVAVAGQMGRELTLAQAYKYALDGDPELSAVMKQREAAKQANAKAASTQRAKLASTSVRTEPAGETSAPAPEDLRSQILAAAALAARR
jgi:hypothetical protein